MGALVLQWPLLLQVLRWRGSIPAVLWPAGRAARVASAARWLRPMPVVAAGGRCCWPAWRSPRPHVYLDTMVLLGSLSTRYPGDLRWAFAAGACVASVLWFCRLGFGARLLQPVFRNAAAWRLLDAGVAAFMLCPLLLLLRPL